MEPFSTIILMLIVAGLVYWLITLLPLPSPFPEIIRVVVIIAVILYLIRFISY